VSEEHPTVHLTEAVRIVGEILGSEHLGKQALEAHRARGLGLEGHQALSGCATLQAEGESR
jgi:hypothetical protein avisC_04896